MSAYCWVDRYSSVFVFFCFCCFFFSSRRRHTRLQGDWSSDVCSSDLLTLVCPRTHARRPPPVSQTCAKVRSHRSLRQRFNARPLLPDRKSTRLNSSHLV